MLQNLRTFLGRGNRLSVLIFALFSITIFLKIVLFHWLCFHDFQPTDADFLRFWLTKIEVAVFIGSFVFLSRKQGWTSVALIIIDIWLIANMIYYRANGLFLNIHSIKMAGNLEGFEDSIRAYLNVQFLWLVVLTIVYIALYVLLKVKVNTEEHTIWKKSVLIWLVMLILTPFMLYPTWKNDSYRTAKEERTLYSESTFLRIYNNYKTLFIPFFRARSYGKISGSTAPPKDWEKHYVQDNSILQFVPAMLINYHTMQSYYKHVELPTDEEIEKFLNDNQSTVLTPKYNLIFLLVESFESWVIELQDDKGEYITPNFNKLAQNGNVCYFNKIKSQAKEGVSGDGQMIYNTGLLPLQQGAACMLYGRNVYPNWAHLYPTATTILPTKSSTWNQYVVSSSYGYKSERYTPDDLLWWWYDKELIDTCISQLYEVRNSLFCSQFVTISMHTPFHYYDHTFAMQFSDDTPETLASYLNCVHYTDNCVGALLDFFFAENFDKNTILVITGDHTIFKDMMLREFQPYAEAHDLPIKDGKNYVPLIIYSPEIKKNIKVDEECYQMDIYPTIIHLIGCEDYYWKGFGVNLLDSTARQNRPCTEEEAYQLSDKLIRSNYFATHSNQE